VLDSTHPAAVKAIEARIDLARTLFLVSSKSGTTLETSSFFYYFWDKLKQLKTDPGANFAAITDPGTPLEKLAEERNFRATWHAPEEVGGRYSALTVFGLVPAAFSRAMGAEMQRPMAVVIVGGTISAAALTLLVLPVAYRIGVAWMLRMHELIPALKRSTETRT
jgi:glucose-6-phosphate isomerase